MSTVKKFGLIGKNISYSFSKKYFTQKFETEDLAFYSYENFDIPNIFEIHNIIKSNPDLKGLNVTIPYKESVMPFLDKLSKKAKAIGAINTIKITKKGYLKGYNTDHYGFKKSLQPLLKQHHTKALILGTGGASKAVAYALEQLGIVYAFVSRNNDNNHIKYNEITEDVMNDYGIIINCTPLGTSPNTKSCPAIPYDYFTPDHIAFDLIYNPEATLFLQKAKQNGAVTKNGMDMLIFQAEKAWAIWNK
jgi:shikimate dehydrogenase